MNDRQRKRVGEREAAHKTYLVIEFVIIFYVYSRSTAGELCAHTDT